MLLFSHITKEIRVIRENTFDVVSKISDDDWCFFEYDNTKKLMEFLKKSPIVDLSCVDVTADKGVEIAESIRSKNDKGFIVLISDETVSPIKYIKPTILAGALLLRPLSENNIKNVVYEATVNYLKKLALRESDGENFVINNRDGKQLVPYERIMFFESRAKKIFVCTQDKEYSFYDTLDTLEKSLSSDFLRCHRSFIVSKTSIKKILFSQNLIELLNGSFIPLSRTYRSVFKELK